jgi:protein ImuB
MSLFGVIHVADFALQAALRHTSQERQGGATALLDGRPARILQRNTDAARAGVLPGMSPAEAQARCTDICLRVRSQTAEQAAAAVLREWAQGVSPWVEETAPGVCTWRWELPGTDRKHPELPLGRLKSLGLEATVGLGPDPGTALLAARSAAFAHLELAYDSVWRVSGPAELETLPLECLAPPPALGRVLAQWGIRRIGDFVALGRSALVERLGPDAGPLWDLASGRMERPLKCLPAPEIFLECVDLEESAVETLEPLLFLLRRLVDALALRLEGLWLAASELRLELGLAGGERHERSFVLPAPSRQPDLLLRMLHTHLEGLRTNQPVVRIALQALASSPLSQQFGLFERALRDPNQFLETLARLEALFGRERVGVPEMEPTHRPDAFRLRTLDVTHTPSPSSPSSATMRQASQGLVLRRFRPPLEVEVIADPVPLWVRSVSLSGRVLESRGPWCSSGEWWTGSPWQRREWDVHLAAKQQAATQKQEAYTLENNGEEILCRLCEEAGVWRVEGIYD